MIKIENTEVLGWEATIRGMRNPMNSWEKSDSLFNFYDYYKNDAARDCGFETTIAENILGEELEDPDFSTMVNPGCNVANFALGPNDHKLMMNLAKAGSVDAKYRRMIVVYADITAPLYWWKEFDTYKVGTVANSCSTMHKIHSKEFTLEDFSCEHLDVADKCAWYSATNGTGFTSKEILLLTIKALNYYRENFLETKDKRFWWQMIQLLPSSYNQRRTVMLNYEVLAGIYPKRKDHKLDCWHGFCDWIKSLPYSEIITLEEHN